MKPNNTIVAEVESTFEGETINYGIDEEAMTHLMGILSEIYTNPTEAVAREYMTNAIDSHIEAGQTKPVEITTPNYFNPNLVIQDFGIGMDIDDIRKTYSKYGTSTKRGSDAVNGMLGIGSKSAFAYSNNFTVVGIKNGRRVVASVSRNEEGVGALTILENVTTTQSNGVTITVPVSDPNRMHEAVSRVTRILPAGQVLVNGVDPSKRSEWSLVASNVISGNVLIKNLWRVPEAGREDRIIMGNVAYEPTMSLRIPGTENLANAIYAEVEMGAVVFAPSREKLMDVARTRTAQTAIRDVFKEHLRDSLLAEVEAAATPHDAMLAFHANKDLLNNLGSFHVDYKGKRIPMMLDNVYVSKKDTELAMRVYRLYQSRDKVQNSSAISYHALVSSMMVVVDAPDKALTATMRKKIDQYMSNNNITYQSHAGMYSTYRSSVLVIPKHVQIVDDPWLDGMTFVDWDDIAAEVLPRAERGSYGDGIKTSGKHFVLNARGIFDLVEVDFDQEILYVTASDVRANWSLENFAPTEGDRWSAYTDADFHKVMARILPALPADTVLVNVYANRTEKFLREYKNAKPLTQTDARAMMVKHIKDTTTDAEIQAWAARHFFNHSSDTYQYVPLADPDRQIVKPTVNHDAAYEKINSFENLLLQDKVIAKKMAEAKDEMQRVAIRVKKRYPLLSATFYGHDKHKAAMTRYYELDYQHYLDSQEENKND